MRTTWRARVRSIGFLSPVRRAALNTTSAAIFNQAMLIVSGSLSARLLGPTDRGHAALLALVPSVICIVGSMGLASAIVFFVAQRPSSTRGVMSALKRELTLQFIVLTSVHIGITVLWLLPKLDGSTQAAAFIALTAVPASFVAQYGLAIVLGQQRFTAFTLLYVAAPLFFSLGIGGLYLSHSGGLILVVIANTLASILAAVAAWVVARQCVRGVTQPTAAASRQELRRFGWKSYFGQVAPIESFRLDQLAVAAALTPAALGYYTVATAFTNVSRFLGGSMGHVLGPYIASLPKEQQAKSLLRGIFFTAALCGVVTAGLLPATRFLVPWLFGAAFRPAIPLTNVLLIAGFLLGIRRAVLPGLQGLGRPEIGSYSEIAAVLVFAALLPLGLGSHSGRGIAMVFLASAVVALAVIALLLAASRARRAAAPSEQRTEASRPSAAPSRGPAAVPHQPTAPFPPAEDGDGR